MSDLITTIRDQGIFLGTPKPWMLAAVELRLLRRQLPAGRRLVAVYGNVGLGYSASPLDDIGTLKICRRSASRGIACTYYAVPKAIIKDSN